MKYGDVIAYHQNGTVGFAVVKRIANVEDEKGATTTYTVLTARTEMNLIDEEIEEIGWSGPDEALEKLSRRLNIAAWANAKSRELKGPPPVEVDPFTVKVGDGNGLPEVREKKAASELDKDIPF